LNESEIQLMLSSSIRTYGGGAVPLEIGIP
jgi:hypothetical protein